MRRIVRPPALLPGLILGLALAACAPSGSATLDAAASSPPPSAPGSTPTEAASGSPAPSGTFVVPSTGFAFDAASVVAYYMSRGYTCGEPRPSEQAAGYLYQACQLVDEAGRTRVVGVVSDPAGALADGFASVRAKPGEAVLAPVDALEPLAGFLGAMLGEERGTALLSWLASHLGDEYAETTSADLHVATYQATPGDRTTLVVEVANDAYLASPRPSPTPG